MTTTIDLAPITRALAEQRNETARRLCLEMLATSPQECRSPILLLLHEAYYHLGDRRGCESTLEAVHPQTDGERLELALLRAGDYHFFSRFDFYRTSAESKRGYSGDEYYDKLQALATDYFTQAKALARTPEQREQVAAVLRRCNRQQEAAELCPLPPPQPVPQPERVGAGVLRGTLIFPDGSPVAEATVTLGLAVVKVPIDPLYYTNMMGRRFQPIFSPLETMVTQTDAAGRYCFEHVPGGRHEFLSVNLDPAVHPVALRFIAHDVGVDGAGETELNAVVTDWQSAPPRPINNPFPEVLQRDGQRYVKIAEDVLANPFRFTFHRQLLSMPLPAEAPVDPSRLVLLCSDDQQQAHPFQLHDGTLCYFSDLPMETDRVFAVYQADTPVASPVWPDLVLQPDADGRTAVVDTGCACFRLPFGTGEEALPPLVQVRGADQRWRGQGRLVLPAGVQVVRRETEVLVQGPLFLTVAVHYTLSNEMAYRLVLTCHRDEGYVLAHEICPELEGAAFEFSLADFLGGRGYLHWKPEGGSIHWSELTGEERLLARLEESVPWWCPPEGFGYAMTPAGLTERDFLGVFTIRRGEWIDRRFAELANGPGPDGAELDWPQPEMVGSTISMITAQTAPGDAFFRFRFFDGERHWGLLVSTQEKNDGPFKAISAVQHKNSSPRLQEFKTWRLDWQNTLPRPELMISRNTLPELRRRREDPAFAVYWERLQRKRTGGGEGFRAIITSDPVLAWTKKRDLVTLAHPHARSILLGRDFGDDYSPVGARPIAPWTEDYDLIVATGVFTPDEERLTRAHLLLMGHMFMQTDFTNWRFNGRNANFEADRADTVGVVGLCFRDNPDGQAMIEHAIARITVMLQIYCTPGSGKWYENPPCYYLQSLTCWCNLAFHLARHGYLDPAAVPRMKEFLSWGILLLTAPTPSLYTDMRDGMDAEAYRALAKVRRIAPVGDHAHLGSWIPEHLILMARFFRQRDPAFADLLSWAYHASGEHGGYFGHPMLFFSMAEPTDLQPPAFSPDFPSRRLEGFGTIFRGNFGKDDECYLLFKQGPCGYRYHRSEGSIILCADGKPLIYDGGEAGEAWRHSTLSFYETHTMLAPGHVERFHTFPALDFAQGVHPVALKPGEPDFLCNDCRHELVELAYQRFHEPRPADARLVLWVKDEYVILHDALDLDAAVPTHWHLQVVAQDETGDLADGYRFRGRFGTDLQVLLPGQQGQAHVESLTVVEHYQPLSECFTMRHLQVDGIPGAERYLAVLRPLPGGCEAVQAKAIEQENRTVGVRVNGAGLDDLHFFRRDGLAYTDAAVSFTGRYGAVLRRPAGTTLVLLDGTKLTATGMTLESTGPAACLCVDDRGAELTVDGPGEILVTLHGTVHRLISTSERESFRLA